MSIALVRRILHVRDVAAVKALYQTHFALPSSRRSPISGSFWRRARSRWHCTWRTTGTRQTASPGSDAPRSPAGSATQLVFAITCDLAVHRAPAQHLLHGG